MHKAASFIMITGTIILLAGQAHSVPPSFELDLKELDAGRKSATKPVKKAQPSAAKQAVKAKEPSAVPMASGAYRSYTVKPGDHIFKILMRDFHLSNAEAERMIPEIARINKIADIRRLSVGQTVQIPTGSPAADRAATKARRPVKSGAPLAAKVVVPDAAPADESHEHTTTPTQDIEVTTPPPVPPPAAVEHEIVPSEPKPGVAKVAVEAPMVAPPPPALAPVGSVLAVTINGGDPLSVFLRLADVLQLRVQQNRVIESRAGTADSFSIKVPLYAEGQDKRLIVAGGGQDPYQYTLFRLLESEGYGVLQFRDSDGFREVTAATLAKLGIAGRLGRYRLVNGKEQEVLGYLLNAQGSKMLLTDAPVGGVWSALEVAGE